MNHQEPKTIAILGGEAVVVSALELLLRGVGYDIRLLEESSAGNAGEQLESIDVLLLAPDLSGEQKEAFLKAVRADYKAAHIPVLKLSTAVKQVLNTQTGVVPWPFRLEDLGWAIEATLAPAPGG